MAKSKREVKKVVKEERCEPQTFNEGQGRGFLRKWRRQEEKRRDEDREHAGGVGQVHFKKEGVFPVVQ